MRYCEPKNVYRPKNVSALTDIYSVGLWEECFKINGFSSRWNRLCSLQVAITTYEVVGVMWEAVSCSCTHLIAANMYSNILWPWNRNDGACVVSFVIT